MSNSLTLAEASTETPVRRDNPVRAEIEWLAGELAGGHKNWLEARAERLATEYAAHAAERDEAEGSQEGPAPIVEANPRKARLEWLRRRFAG
jgi:hypothetical protein